MRPKTCSQRTLEVAGVLLLLAGLTFLVGCQGVSAGNSSSTTQQSGSLLLGSATLDFGNVTAGNSKTLTFTATNSGTASITVSSVTFSTKYFSLLSPSLPATLAAGQSTTISFQFAPNGAGSFAATASIASNASNASANLSLTGTGSSSVTPGQLTLNPPSENFGSVVDGTQQSQTVTLTNTGGANVDISQAAVTGTGFQLSGITVPLTLTPSQSTTLTVSFAPQAGGGSTGAVTISSDASNASLSMSLSGTGIAPGSLGANPSGLNFGSVLVGSNQSLSETVTNTGGSSVTISLITLTGTGFTLSGISAPVTLAAGQSTTFSVGFAPTTSGAASGNITITSTAPNPTLTIPLSGTATTPGQLTLNPTSENFGSVVDGSQQSQTVTLTNTGGTAVNISAASVTGTGFQLTGISPPLTLSPSQTTTFNVAFAPLAAGSASGTVTISSNASNPSLTMSLSGTGVAPGSLGANPSSLSFGNVTVGSNQSLSETVTNTGGSSITISQVAISGTGFTFSGITAPVTLTAGQGATFTVKFSPTATGTASGSITITSNAPNPTLTIPLSGTGIAAVGQLGVSPATLAIGSVVVGTDGTGSGSLTATGANVTVTAAATNNSEFTISGLSLPVTITEGQSVPFTITFSPTTTGAASATLTITSNAQPTTTTEALTGTGTAAPTHTVDLSWTASTSPDISGYNIYRASYTSTCGSFSKINGSLNASTVYTDSSVSDGSSYCYATTAVNTSDEESAYSNIVSNVQIPAP